jgi:hypothetical protein
VRIAGSLITDSPHDVQHRVGTILSRYFAITTEDTFEWEGSVPDWHPGVPTESPTHFARWTEIHPPDLLQVLPWKQPTVAVRGIALAARTGIFSPCEQVETEILPEGPPPANAVVDWEELRGPECFFPWGGNRDNGSWITVAADRIRVKARVCGGMPFGSPGRFKAIYRVGWRVTAPPPAPPPPSARELCLRVLVNV